MARLLLSNKVSGDYEYSFEPLVEENIEKAVSKFLSKYGYVRRIRVNPCDQRIRVLSLVLLDKDGRAEFKENCCDKLGLEYREFIVDRNTIVEKVKEFLEKIKREYKECAEKYSEKLVV